MIEINYKDDYMKPLLLLTQDKTKPKINKNCIVVILLYFTIIFI